MWNKTYHVRYQIKSYDAMRKKKGMVQVENAYVGHLKVISGHTSSN